MMIRLHKNATTTPAIRAYIQASPLSVAALADELGVSEDTIRRWKGRDSVEDRSHTAHRLQTTLTPAQELVVVELRKTLRLPLDDLLVVTREFIHPNVSRSGLNRCLQRMRLPLKGLAARRREAGAQAVQGLRTRVFPCGRQAPTPDARRGSAPLPLCRHRPRDPLGLHSGQIPQNRRSGPGLPESAASGLPDPDHEAAHR